MKKLAFLLLLPACVPMQTTPGQVTQFNGASVTIRGAGDFSLSNAGKGFKPTAEMVNQARQVCPGATFVSGIGTPDNSFTVDYLFRC